MGRNRRRELTCFEDTICSTSAGGTVTYSNLSSCRDLRDFVVMMSLEPMPVLYLVGSRSKGTAMSMRALSKSIVSGDYQEQREYKSNANFSQFTYYPVRNIHGILAGSPTQAAYKRSKVRGVQRDQHEYPRNQTGNRQGQHPSGEDVRHLSPIDSTQIVIHGRNAHTGIAEARRRTDG